MENNLKPKFRLHTRRHGTIWNDCCGARPDDALTIVWSMHLFFSGAKEGFRLPGAPQYGSSGIAVADGPGTPPRNRPKDSGL